MSNYEYRCASCATRFAQTSTGDSGNGAICPNCGSAVVHRFLLVDGCADGSCAIEPMPATAAKTDYVAVLVPVSEDEVGSQDIAPRLDALEGKTIGLLDSAKFNSNTFLDRVEQLLHERYPSLTTVRRRKRNGNSLAHRELIEDLATQCDAVVNAIAD